MATILLSVCLAMFVRLMQLGLTEGKIIRDHCGPGWDVPEANSKWCYKFVHDRLVNYDWYSARHYCQHHNSDLLVITSEREAQWLHTVIVQREAMEGVHGVDFEANSWYIDAHKQLYCDKNKPCWRDGRPLDDLDIFEDIRDSGEYYDCRKQEFKYVPACYAIGFLDDQYYEGIVAYDANCSTGYRNAGFICKKARDSDAVPPEPLLCTHDEAQDVACPAGWRRPDSAITAAPYCYKFDHLSDISWNDAYRTCKELESELLYVENSHEARWITSTLSALMPVTNYLQRYAINMHSYMHDYLSWSFPNHVSRIHSGFEWEKGQPDYSCGIEDCVELWTPHGRFTLNDIPCSTVGLRLGYICKKPVCVVRYKANVTLSNNSQGKGRLTEL